MNVLVVEARVADFRQRGLRAEGWMVSVAPDGEAALTRRPQNASTSCDAGGAGEDAAQPPSRPEAYRDDDAA